MVLQTLVRQSYQWPDLDVQALAGFPNFHPPRPGHGEDTITSHNIKNGYATGHAVSVSGTACMWAHKPEYAV
jgi:hypothetical protein